MLNWITINHWLCLGGLELTVYQRLHNQGQCRRLTPLYPAKPIQLSNTYVRNEQRPSRESWSPPHSWHLAPRLRWESRSRRHEGALRLFCGIEERIWVLPSCTCALRFSRGRRRVIVRWAKQWELGCVSGAASRCIVTTVPKRYIITSTIGEHAAPMLKPCWTLTAWGMIL